MAAELMLQKDNQNTFSEDRDTHIKKIESLNEIIDKKDKVIVKCYEEIKNAKREHENTLKSFSILEVDLDNVKRSLKNKSDDQEKVEKNYHNIVSVYNTTKIELDSANFKVNSMSNDILQLSIKLNIVMKLREQYERVQSKLQKEIVE